MKPLRERARALLRPFGSQGPCARAGVWTATAWLVVGLVLASPATARTGFFGLFRDDDPGQVGSRDVFLGEVDLATGDVSFLPTAEPLMQELADEVGALVALAMRDRKAAMLTRCWRPRNTPAIWLTEGHRLPLTRSATGRTLLAASTPSSDDTDQTREK